ncbi:MAG: hypothetical protein LBL57_04070 [Tannerella sp.]|jgi:hypothetical protein|nr:hypothetical protein [Tannerella sp.]
MSTGKRTLYLSSWINFGKYRTNPETLSGIIETPEGRKWVKYLSEKAYDMEFHQEVADRIKELENG